MRYAIFAVEDGTFDLRYKRNWFQLDWHYIRNYKTLEEAKAVAHLYKNNPIYVV